MAMKYVLVDDRKLPKCVHCGDLLVVQQVLRSEDRIELQAIHANGMETCAEKGMSFMAQFAPSTHLAYFSVATGKECE